MLYFNWRHFPPHLAQVSEPFCAMAVRIVRELPECHERLVALRKLLEAKDAAMRACTLDPLHSVRYKDTADG